MAYRVDNIPRYLQPLLKAYGIAGAAGFTAFLQSIRTTCHWEFSSNHKNNSNVPYNKPCIHCTWHENVPPYLAYYILSSNASNVPRQKHVWLQHPTIRMKAIHEFLEWNDMEYVLGSSGHGGQQALDQLIQKLISPQSHEEELVENNYNRDKSTSPTYSTAFFPDGPNGPLKVVKPGVVHVAQATGLPIIPIQFQVESSWRVGWDQKHFPKPFSTVRIREHEPIYVDGKATNSHREEILSTLQETLGA